MPGERKEKVGQALKNLAAEYFERESSGLSLITITACDLSPDLRYAKLFMTVLPESKEVAALDFAKRQLGGLRDYAKKKLVMKVLPTFSIEIDLGEKHRQKIDRLLAEDKHK